MHRADQSIFIQSQHFTGQFAECFQFIPADIFLLIFGESIYEKRSHILPEKNDGAEAARPTLAFPGQPALSLHNTKNYIS